jgi:hypothetical protein
MPDQSTVTLDVADNYLVFNGNEFVNPSYLSYIELYTMPIAALSAEHRDIVVGLQADVKIKALVISKSSVSVPVTDPSVVAEPDPANGECICGLTCNGTSLRFVTVTPENP